MAASSKSPAARPVKSANMFIDGAWVSAADGRELTVEARSETAERHVDRFTVSLGSGAERRQSPDHDCRSQTASRR